MLLKGVTSSLLFLRHDSRVIGLGKHLYTNLLTSHGLNLSTVIVVCTSFIYCSELVNGPKSCRLILQSAAGWAACALVWVFAAGMFYFFLTHCDVRLTGFKPSVTAGDLAPGSSSQKCGP